MFYFGNDLHFDNEDIFKCKKILNINNNSESFLESDLNNAGFLYYKYLASSFSDFRIGIISQREMCKNIFKIYKL